MKKILCFIILTVFLLNTPVFAYNKDLCLEYAAFHFDDGKGLCAEFVADCLRAGGLNISANECNDLFDELTVEYKCDCSYDRTKRALISLGKEEIDSIFAEKRENGEEEKIELECHFCDKKYAFTKEDTDKLF